MRPAERAMCVADRRSGNRDPAWSTHDSGQLRAGARAAIHSLRIITADPEFRASAPGSNPAVLSTLLHTLPPLLRHRLLNPHRTGHINELHRHLHASVESTIYAKRRHLPGQGAVPSVAAAPGRPPRPGRRPPRGAARRHTLSTARAAPPPAAPAPAAAAARCPR